MQTIIIPSWKQGGTLSQIAAKYGTTVQELQKANNITDPNVIKEGATLIIPDKTSSSVSLSGTLGTGGTGGGSNLTENTLPETKPDQLTSFRNLLQTVSKRATQEAQTSGVGALGNIGFDPSKVSGGTLSGILGFISSQKTTGIADIYKQTTDLLDETKKRAENQLQMMISTGAIADSDDRVLEKLSSMTDTPLDYLQQIRTTLKTKTEAKQTDAGRITQLNQFLKNKIGEDGKISAQSYMSAYKEWIGLNGTISDFKYAYPVEEWLGEWEYKNLPAGWRPSTKITDVKSLPSDQQVFINQVQAKINSKELKYDDAVSKYSEIAVYLKIPSKTEGGLFQLQPIEE
jgi:LysM repeat protein